MARDPARSIVDQFLAQAQPPGDGRAAFMGSLNADIAETKAERRAARRAARAASRIPGVQRGADAMSNLAAGQARMGTIGQVQPQFLNPVAAPAPVAPRAIGAGTPGGAIIPATSREVSSLASQLAPQPAPQPLALGPGPAPAPVQATMAPSPVGQLGAGPAPRAMGPMSYGASGFQPAARAAATQAATRAAASAPYTGALPYGGVVSNAAGAVPAAAQSFMQRAGGLRGIAGRASGPLAAGTIASQISSSLYDDTNSTVDEGVTGALQGAGVGGAIGAAIGAPFFGVGAVPAGAIGAGLGALAGGAIGLFGPKNTGSNAVESEFAKLTEKMNGQFDELGVPDEVRQSIYEQINMQVTLNAGSKDDVRAIFQQGTVNLPALLADYEAVSQQRSRSAAIQAAILPLMKESSQAGVAAAQRSQGWLNQAASYQPDPQVAALLRAQSEQVMANTNQSNTAAYGQMAAGPIIQELTGLVPQFTTQGGVPTTDTAALLAQLGLGA
jgi:hypothetical protein